MVGNLKILVVLGTAAMVACGGPRSDADADDGQPPKGEDVAPHNPVQTARSDDPHRTYETLLQRYGLLPVDGQAQQAWRALAQEGYAPAQLAVGVAYALGKGISRDENQALGWMRQAAEAGSATAQYDLSLLHMSNGEFAVAYEWSSVAAHRGSGPVREEAARHNRLLALVLPAVDLAKAQRSATDWLETLPADATVNNVSSDAQLAFARVADPPDGRPWSDFGWRDKAKWIQTSVQASLRAGETLR